MDIIRLTEPIVDTRKHPGPPMPYIDPSGIKRKTLDIPYSTVSGSLKLDLYLPEEGEGPFPTIVFFHGGAFWGGYKNDFQCLYALNGIFHGYAVASVEYRVSDEAVFPAAVLDCKTSVRFLRANAEKYKLDPDRFAAMGDSAGAYMAAMVGFSAGNPVFNMPEMEYPEESDAVQAVVGLFGAYDLAVVAGIGIDPNSEMMPDVPEDVFMGFVCSDHPEIMHFAWPGAYITPDCPPTLIQAGTADELVGFQGSVDLVARINTVCKEERSELQLFEGAFHGDEVYSTKENEECLFTFLDRFLK